MRDISIDALRGIGIAVVVLSHVVTEAKFSVGVEPLRLAVHGLLYAANVQLLAFVSGLVTRRISLPSKALTLLLPLCAWLVLFNLPAGRSFLSALLYAPSGVAGVFNGYSPMWFLWALFVSLALARLLRRHPALMFSVAVVSPVVWPLLPSWTLLRGLGLVFPYVVLGAWWRRDSSGRTSSVERFWPIVLLASGGVALIAVRLAGGPVWVGSEMPQSAVPFVGLLSVASAGACAGGLGLARSLTGLPERLLAFLGTASLGIYGFHWLVIVLLPDATSASRPLEIPVIFLVLLVCSTVATVAISRSRYLTVLLLGGRAPLTELLSNKGIEQTAQGRLRK